MIFAIEKGNQCPEWAFDGQIHSVFHKAINIITNDASTPWVSLLDNTLANTPCGYRVALSMQPGFRQLKVGERVYFRGGILRFPSNPLCNIDTRSAKFWKNPPLILRYEKEQLIINSKRSEVGLIKHINIKLPKTTIKNKTDYLSYLNLTSDKGFLHSPSRVVDNIGKGDGLTPSGDDFICGILAVLHQANKFDNQFSQVLNELTKAIQARWHQTTDVSRHYLAQALDGDFSQPVQWFVYSLFHSSSDIDVDKALNDVLEIGSSSGADIISGILYGVEQLLF